MPFPKQEKRTFNKAGIEDLTPNQFGCYGIYREGVWIYVGKGDIRERLLDHLNGDNDCITIENPTHYVAEVTAIADGREKQLILELSPVCNQRVG